MSDSLLRTGSQVQPDLFCMGLDCFVSSVVETAVGGMGRELGPLDSRMVGSRIRAPGQH